MTGKQLCAAALLLMSISLSSATMEVRDTGRQLLGSESGSHAGSKGGGSVTANAGAHSTGGTVKAHAKAEGFSYEENGKAFAQAVSEASSRIKSGKGEAAAEAKALAKAEARAVAIAYTKTFAGVSSDGANGHGCASAGADAYAAADAVAIAISFALAEAIQGYTTAEAEAAAESISVATAEAFSSSYSNVCVFGEGDAYAANESIATSIVDVIAIAITEAFAYISHDDSIAVADAHTISDAKHSDTTQSQSDAFTDTGPSGIGFADAGGDAIAQSDQVKVKCPDNFDSCCNAGRKPKSCDCSKKQIFNFFSHHPSPTCTAEKFKGSESPVIYTVLYVDPYKHPYEVGYKCFCDSKKKGNPFGSFTGRGNFFGR